MKVEDSKKNFQNPIDNQSQKQLSEKVLFFNCPYCKINIPKIIDIKKDFTKNLVFITFNCKCLNTPKVISINELYEQLNKKSSLDYKCYKHKDKEGIEYCENCKYFMCDICKEYHKDFVKNHKTTSIQLLNKNENCHIHLNNKLEFYCEKCKRNTCIDCIKKNHKDHLIITIKEYWEKIYDKLKFQTVIELKNKLETERKNYENIITLISEKITYLMNKLAKLREFIGQYYYLSVENHKILSSIILSVFSIFFNQKDNPDYTNCVNCEKLIPMNLIYLEECNELGIIFSGFSKLINKLSSFESTFLQRELISTIDLNDFPNKLFDNKNKEINLSLDSNTNVNTNELTTTLSNSIKKRLNLINYPTNNLLNKKTKLNSQNYEEGDNVIKKQKKHHITKIPLNEKINKNHLLNINNNVINNSTTNNIIFPLKVGKQPIKVTGNIHFENNKKKDIFTFDDVICKKYIDSQSNDFLETFSNNSVFPDGYECIHLGKVEDNKMIKNKKKKIEEKNNTTEETNNNTNINTNTNTNINTNTNTNIITNQNTNTNINTNTNTNINSNTNNNNNNNNNITNSNNNSNGKDTTKQNKDDTNFFNNIFYKNNTNSVGDNLSSQNLNTSLKNNLEINDNSINFEKI